MGLFKKQDKPQKVDKKVLSFFILAFPTILIVGLAMLASSTWWAWILLALFQFIMLKQFLDEYYDAEE